VCGLFLSRRETFNGAENAKNTITRHGAPSENDLMKVLVLCRHDGEIELARVEWPGQKMMCKCKCTLEGDVSQSPRTASETVKTGNMSEKKVDLR